MASFNQHDLLCPTCSALFTGHWTVLPTEDADDPHRGHAGGEDSDKTSKYRQQLVGNVRLDEADVAQIKDTEELEMGLFLEVPDEEQSPKWMKLDAAGSTYSPSHHSYRNLERSAASGCSLCSLILPFAKYEVDCSAVMETKSEKGLDRLQSIASVYPDPDIEPEQALGSFNCVLELFYFITDSEDPLASVVLNLQSITASTILPQNLRQSTQALSPTTRDTISQWMNECTNNHPQCHSVSAEPHELPSRLLDVGYGADDTTTTVNLVETSALMAPVRYVTLSHRWGEHPVSARLLRENYTTFSASLPQAGLTPIFRDAISVARSLGFHYLWIDALCIIQNSPEDWLNEATKMQTVYLNSALNFAALISSGANGRLFPESDGCGGRAIPCVIEATWTGLEPGKFYVMSVRDMEVIVDANPLNNRAWVLQERLLAPRTLHFAQHQLYWGCTRHTACEVWPMGLPLYVDDKQPAFDSPDFEEYIYYDRNSLFRRVAARESLPSDDQELTDMNDVWLALVRVYAALDLTFESDRLVAIGGIAKVFQRKMGVSEENYVAGFWLHDLTSSLLWHGSELKKLKICTVPSWSWASVSGQIYRTFELTRPEPDAEFLIDILESNITHEGNHRFGPVTAGHLTLQGPIYRISLANPLVETFPSLDVEPFPPSLQKLTLGNIDIPRNPHRDAASGRHFHAELDDVTLYDKWPSAGMRLHFLKIVTYRPDPSYRNFSHKYAGESVSEGLILASAAFEPSVGSYVRIGWMKTIGCEQELAMSLVSDSPETGEYIMREPLDAFTIRLL